MRTWKEGRAAPSKMGRAATSVMIVSPIPPLAPSIEGRNPAILLAHPLPRIQHPGVRLICPLQCVPVGRRVPTGATAINTRTIEEET
jgi:hypothetical protein